MKRFLDWLLRRDQGDRIGDLKITASGKSRWYVDEDGDLWVPNNTKVNSGG